MSFFFSVYGGFKGYIQNSSGFTATNDVKNLIMGLYLGPSMRFFFPDNFKFEVRYSYERALNQRIVNGEQDEALLLGQWMFMLKKTF